MNGFDQVYDVLRSRERHWDRDLDGGRRVQLPDGLPQLRAAADLQRGPLGEGRGFGAEEEVYAQ